jgi:hypothetical protein
VLHCGKDGQRSTVSRQHSEVATQQTIFHRKGREGRKVNRKVLRQKTLLSNAKHLYLSELWIQKFLGDLGDLCGESFWRKLM